jgi:hypothetical protein
VWILIPDADGKKHKLPGRIISIFFLDIIEDLNAAKIEPSSKHAVFSLASLTSRC